SFSGLLPGIDKVHSWLELEKMYRPDVIPAFADQTVITWGLIKKVGDTVEYVNENGEALKLVLVGGLANSIFQGNILISGRHFRQNFPSVSGSKIMLVDAPDHTDPSAIQNTLNSYLPDYGVQVTNTVARLAEFNSVTNTYLTVFMFLGGLGVIIGTLGMAIVLLRNMLDRRQELALLLALGFKKSTVFKVIFYENLFLLLAGLTIGFLSAIIGILPSILSASFAMNTAFLIILVIVILLNGILWIFLPLRMILKRVLISMLSSE
nr:ABC transporter permease [Bacteroidota bacterium]